MFMAGVIRRREHAAVCFILMRGGVIMPETTIFAFENTAHNPELVYNELDRCDISTADVIKITVHGDAYEGLQKLYNCIKEGDVVFVGTIADFIYNDTLISSYAVLYRLESAGITLRSHLERGCTYAELNAHLETAIILQEVLEGGNLCNYR